MPAAGAKLDARKSPRQARSRATVDAILSAAARVLTREGYAAFTTNRVAEVAGVSVGSLYQYFPSKEALIAALSQRHLDAIAATLRDVPAAMAGRPLPDVIHALIAANVAAHMIDPKLHAVLSDDVPPMGRLDWRVTFEAEARHLVRSLLEHWRDDLAVSDLDLATYVVIRKVEACVHDGVRSRRADMASGALTDEVARLVTLYLTGGQATA